MSSLRPAPPCALAPALPLFISFSLFCSLDVDLSLRSLRPFVISTRRVARCPHLSRSVRLIYVGVKEFDRCIVFHLQTSARFFLKNVKKTWGCVPIFPRQAARWRPQKLAVRRLQLSDIVGIITVAVECKFRDNASRLHAADSGGSGVRCGNGGLFVFVLAVRLLVSCTAFCTNYIYDNVIGASGRITLPTYTRSERAAWLMIDSLEAEPLRGKNQFRESPRDVGTVPNA